MVLQVLDQKVEDVSLAVDEQVLKHLALRLGHQCLHNLVEVAAQDRLDLVLVEKLKQLVHDRVVVNGIRQLDRVLPIGGKILSLHFHVDCFHLFVVTVFVKRELEGALRKYHGGAWLLLRSRWFLNKVVP